MDFSQYSGFVLFMFIFTAGFWLLIFLLSFVVPYWLTLAWIDRIKENKERKHEKKRVTSSSSSQDDENIL
jgi:hypothetical protein